MHTTKNDEHYICLVYFNEPPRFIIVVVVVVVVVVVAHGPLGCSLPDDCYAGMVPNIEQRNDFTAMLAGQKREGHNH
eukprot:761610-Amphidinium_carterae.1